MPESSATVARSVNAQLDDELERAPGLYSFGSPNGAPPSTPIGPPDWIDPNGRLDVSVAVQSDGRYWVTDLSIESHA